jgi:uncharacterized protein
MATHKTNRLADETSPYLLQHKHNPVDWYAWGPDAFAAAREQNKPIFLSVGYSTCYWCHVMERQCFENADIAAVMNKHFINIKVDREERPDVDQLYMTAVQVITRQGGWPMSVWMLPDRRPFFAGTYFPPEEAHGRPSFPGLLEGIAEAYATRLPEIEQTAANITQVLHDLAQVDLPEAPMTLTKEWIENLLVRSINDYEPRFGGFGGAPKFPRQTLLELCLHALQSPIISQQIKDEITPPLLHTLHAMANGGIRDQLGGGFHRYSTDAQWLVPHFEIMLYDNAMLAWIYAQASRVLNEPRFADVARRIADFVLRDMTSPDGAFYTAWDAEVEAREGLNYLWTIQQIEHILSPREAARFASVYGLDQGPNFADPHHGDGTPDTNVLYLARPEEENAADIIAMRAKLLARREKRPKPLLDTKIITSWNALMIRGLAKVAEATNDKHYLLAAQRAASVLLAQHRVTAADTNTISLHRTSRDGVFKYEAFLDDYAFLAQALLDIGQVDDARQIIHAMQQRFEDDTIGGFFFTAANADDLIVRQKNSADTPLPAGNAVAAVVCQQVGLNASAEKALGIFAEMVNHHAPSMSTTLSALLMYIQANGSFSVEAGTRVERPASIEQTAMDVVTVSHEWPDDEHITLNLLIDDAYHLAADALHIDAGPGVIDHVYLPAAVAQSFAYAGAPLNVYTQQIACTIRLASRVLPGESVKLRLRYQPCTQDACLVSVTRELVINR